MDITRYHIYRMVAPKCSSMITASSPLCGFPPQCLRAALNDQQNMAKVMEYDFKAKSTMLLPPLLGPFLDHSLWENPAAIL